MYKKIALAACLTATLVACDRNEDFVDPTVTLEGIENGDLFNAGESIEFTAEFSDNSELGSYTVTISPDSALENGFMFSKKKGLEDEDARVNDMVELPSDLEGGDYNFIVTVLDDAGNSAMAERSIILVGGAPVINNENIADSNSISFFDEISIEADITDNTGLEEIDLLMINDGTGFQRYQETITLGGEKRYMLNESINGTFTPGASYTLTITATNIEGESTEKMYTFVVE